MRRTVRSGFVALAFAIVAACGPVSRAQQKEYRKPTELPNPYRLVEGWPMLPKNMNGGRWGEVIRVVVDPKQNVWVFHRCFNVVPAGSATCARFRERLTSRASPPPSAAATSRTVEGRASGAVSRQRRMTESTLWSNSPANSDGGAGLLPVR